ncbi:hypothetical protein [Caminicella sporogenes]|uniref:hypothetical protein n=1 Tax=Caminicella sporogenes TaxID=166485 RepID=UPI00253F8614|nr:hypothetical protein [Caminicella sporogenes]WIF94306.1 hypothetical protein QNI18_08420 [Caminicella sporogenes]
MPRPKKSVEILVKEGKTHLTKEEIESRREQESKLIGSSDKIECPRFIQPKKMKKSG